MSRKPNRADCSGGLTSGLESFQIMEDLRTGGNRRHYFGEMLFMTVSAMLCGMNNFAEVVAFCEEQTDRLKKWICLPNGVPRAETFYNILNNDTGAIKSMPRKRLRALMNQSYRERLLSLA